MVSPSTDASGTVLLAEGDAQVMPFDAWAEALVHEAGTPLVVEYGETYRDKITPPAVVDHQTLLHPEALLLTLNAHQTTRYTGNALLTLSPDYMQQTLAERDWGG